jgi:hypothetical protein
MMLLLSRGLVVGSGVNLPPLLREALNPTMTFAAKDHRGEVNRDTLQDGSKPPPAALSERGE